MHFLKLESLRTDPISLQVLVAAVGNVVRSLVALSAQSAAVAASVGVLALPGSCSVAATVYVALVAEEFCFVSSGIVVAVLEHLDAVHDLLDFVG